MQHGRVGAAGLFENPTDCETGAVGSALTVLTIPPRPVGRRLQERSNLSAMKFDEVTESHTASC